MKIHIQKPGLTFWDKHLINFLVASMPFTYEGIINNLNMCNVLTLEETVHAFCTKETKLKDLVVIKEESIHFVTQKGFCGGQKR